MDFRRLEVFTKAYELKSFSKAGQSLYLSQPTVSEHIRLLEQDLGLSLFDRQGKEVVPTKAGRFLYQYAKQIMALRQDSLRAMQQFRDKGVGDLLIGGSNIPGQYILPGLLGRFKKQFPGIQIRLWIGDTQHIQNKVLEGTIELGVVGALIEHRRISSQLLTTDEMVCISGPKQAKGKQKTVDAKNLFSLPFILREPGSGTRKALELALKKIHLDLKELQVAAEMGSNEAVRQAVKAGLGISIISRRAVSEDLEQGRLQEIKVRKLPLSRNFYLITLKQRTLSPLAQEFKDFILKEI
ncbi:MAG: selenium metabolism-associated LysR family transcriptional regulator [Thermodesulfobacteriota bacterium]|jgi:DNA-binding transcriptional LysR family regulator